MKRFVSVTIMIVLTSLIHEWATARMDFEYNMFSDSFNLLSWSLDLGIWLVIFIPIYFVFKKVIFKKRINKMRT
ncbi:hypothetical protein D8M06_16740 [Oceanobacillus halophilus]|uniref:Uncharacterized protein n=1 Tax=Oceanobacillus halophilus TaxID=930130 RepID=A0A494ZUP5_9BACI|nr:hypothetical protein D8M06_16740 [Oceanobacillus halophilus]